MEVRFEHSSKEALAAEFEKPYFAALADCIHREKREGKVIFPPGRDIFRAFDLPPLDKVKAVILGQDPYHEKGQAMGMSFSVTDGVPAPPSLKNIFKEIESDLGVRMSGRTNLEKWATQGVLLLNSILTVREGVAASHSRIGWENFTDAVIRTISEKREGVVFMLWGNFARSKKELIDGSKHLILEAAHASTLARGAFFGCRHFSTANAYLRGRGVGEIDWRL